MEEFLVSPCDKCGEQIRIKVNSVIIDDIIKNGVSVKCNCGYHLEITPEDIKNARQ